MNIRTKRIYDDPEPADGTRVLVDGLWPRGVSKDEARLDRWLRSVAPSDELREWYDHDVERWEAFKERYELELDDADEPVDQLLDIASSGTLTLLYAAKDRDHNNAVALKEHLEERIARTDDWQSDGDTSG